MRVYTKTSSVFLSRGKEKESVSFAGQSKSLPSIGVSFKVGRQRAYLHPSGWTSPGSIQLSRAAASLLFSPAAGQQKLGKWEKILAKSSDTLRIALLVQLKL
ncbi:hypothetical protein AVEN_203716-1 [Araneus ventricosus]|uniref:Uncharacterized protein n=1 Tax=Araneus ventricosus TaxID=182803 RepID=A0A4Y2ITF4_ARAVE|nr:hypothetical protein AVEN_203716-1 [Araneus ventricosus]